MKMLPIAPDIAAFLTSKLKEMGINLTCNEMRNMTYELDRKIFSGLSVKQHSDDVDHFLEYVILQRHDFWLNIDRGPLRTIAHNQGYMNRVEAPFICKIAAVYASSLTVCEVAKLLAISEVIVLKQLEFRKRSNSLTGMRCNVQKLFGRKIDGQWRIPICQFNSRGKLMRNHKILMGHVDDAMDIIGFHHMLEVYAPDDVGSLKEWIEHRMTKELKRFKKVADREQYLYYAFNPSAGH